MRRKAERGGSVLEDLQLPDRYHLVRRIASGGMASVWCAEDQMLGRRVAIKLLSEAYAHDEPSVRRFQREARVAARLSGHRHVVTIYDVGTAADGRGFIVMEYLPGGTVADALHVGAVERGEAIQWIRETASALDYAHERGVIHRDIKPGNLLLDCDRVLHVADFGIASIATDDTITRSDEVLGTAGYLAPERVVGREASAASDRYSLAVAAFELLVGERPFTASPFSATARQHLEEEPPLASLRNPDLPRSVDPVLVRGMAKREEDRWPTAGAFAEALDGAMATRSSRAPTAVLRPGARRPAPKVVAAAKSAPPAGPGRPSRSSARPRVLALAALLAVAVAAVAVVIGLGSPSKTPTQRLAARPAQRTKRAVRKPAAPAPAPAAQTNTTATTSPPAGTPAATSAGALEARGHALMADGSYQAAIPVLRQAVAAASPSSLTYAYALYDLGHSLRLAGDLRQAVQVLYQRMQIPNQTGVVHAELQLALQELGAQSGGASGGASPSTTAGQPAGQGSGSHGRRAAGPPPTPGPGAFGPRADVDSPGAETGD